jgi:hypothetical protein
MLRQCTSIEALENSTSDFNVEQDPLNPSTQTPAQALQRDPVAIVRNIANTIRSSQLRRQEFKEIITTGNRRSRWLDPQNVPRQIAHLTIIRDSPIRWGSTYLMVERILYLRQVSYCSTIIKIKTLNYVLGNRSLYFASGYEHNLQATTYK